MAPNSLSPADEFEKAWQGMSGSMDTRPALHTALEHCLDCHNTLDEVVRIFEVQYQQSQPALIDEMTAVAAASTDLTKIKFVLFYGRMLWTYRFWKNMFEAAIAEPGCNLPVVDHFLPQEGSRYSVYRDWFTQYIYAALYEVTWSRS